METSLEDDWEQEDNLVLELKGQLHCSGLWVDKAASLLVAAEASHRHFRDAAFAAAPAAAAEAAVAAVAAVSVVAALGVASS